MRGDRYPSATWLLVRPRGGSTAVFAMQVVAAAVATLLSFAVAIVALTFWRVPAAEPAYRVLALALAVLLALPLTALSSAAARLSARSREERLATLRLLGVSAPRVRRLAVAESTAVAAIGVAVGTALGSLLPFALQFFPVHGSRLGPADLALPWWLTLVIPLALIGVAALSGLLGLRKVILSPLGVSARTDAPRMSWARVFLTVGAVGAAVAVTRAVSPGWGLPAAVAALSLALLASMAALSALGPFVLLWFARRRAARAADPAKLIAFRTVADAPRAAWRGVSVIALATFIVVPVGSLLGYLDAIQRSESGALLTQEQLFLLRDARSLLVVLAAVAFLVATCQLAMAQVASIIERRELFIALHRIGMQLPTMQRSRLRSATLPAVAAVTIALAATAALTAPVIFAGAVTSPLFTLTVAAVLLCGLALVAVCVAATAPVLRQELARDGGGSR
ncbi:FtsX-like permease family protein [Leucobacter komagatae]|uniref:ABC3 transporter permease C-terminal domain-containing protein n=1 Tax=Leucobacter komagatae TaxID=55969 RepID=A0A0D0IPA3_9MICO|nr:FtsX-like permease family protein [Leucobacter komagatae]KIP53389.1 hypothetical protein SD72_04000 [Leucobacter komagatae]